MPRATSRKFSASNACSTGWAVVTDLDGTLLDGQYDLSEAAVALNRLAASSFNVRVIVLASSKTLPEMMLLAALCEQPPVLIFENGAGRALPMKSLSSLSSGSWSPSAGNPNYEIQTDGVEYQQLCELLAGLRHDLGCSFIGFSDMQDSELAEYTGLSIAAARLARTRRASEPVLWQDSEAQFAAFSAALAVENLQVVAGGRFLHVSSVHDKAACFSECLPLCAPVARVLACGDAENDRELLERADHALVFPRAEGGYLLDASKTTNQAPAAGGGAWLQSVLAALDSYQFPVEGQCS